ncbi:MAG: hypothetical protein ACRD6N_04065, partial [Pyrinomonadaceae bacterium]
MSTKMMTGLNGTRSGVIVLFVSLAIPIQIDVAPTADDDWGEVVRVEIAPEPVQFMDQIWRKTEVCPVCGLVLLQKRRLQMKRVILLIAFLSVSSSAVVGQSGHAGQEENLRGLKGLRLVVMFARADAMAEAERPAILKLVEAEATAKFEKAGIPLLRFANEVEDAGFPQLIVYITLDKPNGFVYPLATNVKLLQRVRL